MNVPRPPPHPLAALAERALLGTTAQGVAVVDGGGRVAVANEPLARLLGVGEAELLGAPAHEFVAPNARDELDHALQHASQGVVLPLRRRDGASAWVQLSTSPLLDGSGTRVGVLCLMGDVSEWRRSEQALRTIVDTSRALAGELDFEAIARAVAASIDGGVVVGLLADPDGIVLRACAAVDPRAESALRPLVGRALPVLAGTVGEEVVRLRKPVLLRQEGTRRLQPAFASIAEQLGLGSLIAAPLLVHGRVTGVMSVFRDARTDALGPEDVPLVCEIADRAAMALERARLSEEQARATERLRLLADAGTLLGPSLEVDATMDALVRFAVESFADLCAVRLFDEARITPHAVAARDAARLEPLRRAMEPYTRAPAPPEATRAVVERGVAALVRTVDETALRRLAVDDGHVEALRALGLRSVIAAPLVARGAAIGLVSLARTGGRPYDESDLAVARELASRAALAVDNARLFRSANEAVSLRDEFLSIASHELNTPLTPLKMQLDSLRRGNFPPDRAAEKLDAASRQVTRLIKLVSELLDVSRIRGGRLHLEPEPFDLAQLLAEVVGRMRDEAERAGVTLVLAPAGPCVGNWDRMRIDQVVTNLVSNALKYGGGRPVDVALSRSDGAASIAVHDRGIGIAPEHQGRIFERFERAASARYYGGFGLGLWIARQIVEASGGTIAVESAPGEGATFVVRLPLAREAPSLRSG